MAKRARKKKKAFPFTYLAAAMFMLFLILLFWQGSGQPGSSSSEQSGASASFKTIAEQVVAQARVTKAGSLAEKDHGPVYVALRGKGQKLGEAWHSGGNWQQNLQGAATQAQAQVALNRRADVDTLEICLTHGYFEVNPQRDRRPFTNAHRGIRGLELSIGQTMDRWSPTRLIAGNISFDRALERFGKSQNLSKEALATRVKKRLFEGQQFLVTLEQKPRIQPMMRGNQIVPPEAVTQATVKALARSMATWMENQVSENGRMTYQYFPSRGAESKSNNMIRQFMASLCLARINRSEFASSSLEEKLFKNLNYNFQQFYRQDQALGYIFFRDKAKLGAAALAALAVLESPFREQHAERFEGLSAMVAHLQEENGGFRTFYQPPERRDNQNFYPGEALLFWAIQYQQNPDAALLQSFMKAFHFYRSWHRDPQNRNPAFVPWHTQAYYLMWQKTKVPALAEFIFEMNDWVLPLQQWENTTYPDMQGRFYDPGRPDYGPPHASSTGVYLEGLIDAFALARLQNDRARENAYRRAILRGLRSVMQLQFTDDLDMYYISKRKAVRGGLRTTIYDNRVRVDNVQHNLMAILKILDQFEPKDYDSPKP